MNVAGRAVTVLRAGRCPTHSTKVSCTLTVSSLIPLHKTRGISPRVEAVEKVPETKKGAKR